MFQHLKSFMRRRRSGFEKEAGRQAGRQAGRPYKISIHSPDIQHVIAFAACN